MNKLLFFCVRRPEIPRAEYERILLEDHAPRVLGRFADVRSFAIDLVEVGDPSLPAYDTISIVEFEGPPREEAIARALEQAAKDVHVYLVHSIVQRADLDPRAPGAAGCVKALYPLRRKDGEDPSAFRKHWLERHVPKALRHHPTMLRYVTNIVERRLSSDGEDWDGFTEGYHPSVEDYEQRMFDSAQGQRAIMEDVASFIGRLGILRTREYVLR